MILLFMIFLIPLQLAGLGKPVHAASAVAFDSKRSVYGYAYNISNEDAAKKRAVQSCLKRTGRSCRVILSCAREGYGAIFMGRLRDHPISAIGASCGAADSNEANRRAAQNCRDKLRSVRCDGPVVMWHDTVK
jgi:hypothetical protein